jgi:hypothetical protein
MSASQFLDSKTIAELTARMYLDTGAVRFMTDKPFISRAAGPARSTTTRAG